MPHLHRLPTAVTAVVCAAVAVVGLQAATGHDTADRAEAARPADARPVAVGHTEPRLRGCRSGLVALTFDDGPRPGTTAALVRTLRTLEVPATFFQLGDHVADHPRLARMVDRAGFTVGNHSWDHPLLTHRRNGQVSSQLKRTDRALHRAGVEPSDLMRPPYGGVDARVRDVVRRLGLVLVLWTIDSEDWRGGTPAQVAGRVLRALRPHTTNVVLQHDGVRTSWASVRAVPQIVRTARARGYCFTGLGPRGAPRTPVPAVVVTATDGQERGRRAVQLRLRLTTPTTRPVSVRVHSVDASATGADYTAFAVTVRFAPGTSAASVRVPVSDDRVRERRERFRVRLSDPRDLTLTARSVDARIRDDDR